MRGIAGLALGVVIGAIVACGGAQLPPPAIDPRENEITALWTQIRDWRREAHMQLDPTPQDLLQYSKLTIPQAKHVCTANHDVPKPCNDVCNLADDICDNAERICQISDQLGRDNTWAQDKCTSAKASCREAEQNCCNCSANPPETAP